MIYAIVGSGGKTTLIHKSAEKYRKQGKKVFVTTSTHMFAEPDTLLTDDADTILRELQEKGYVMAGQPIPERMLQEDGNNGQWTKSEERTASAKTKMKALSKSTYDKVCRAADIVLLEADGSRHLPIKFPNQTEPVLYGKEDEIIIVTGLHALGRPMRDAAHRPELVKACLGITEDTIITAEHIQTLLRKGYLEPLRQKYPEKKITTRPSHDDSLYQKALAALIQADMDVSLIREEWFASQPTLIICGGGHVSCELVKIASCLEFRIKVLDDRAEFADPERFPQANEVICDSFEHLEKYLEPNAYYCVVTRGHKDDYTCVKTILQHPCQYLGMIGSKAKVKNTFDHLRADGIEEEKINTIFAPIGLPIKSITPAEIAVSILAQIILEKNSRQTASAPLELLESTEPGTLCIIIEKTGSAPRGTGSMMFVPKERCCAEDLMEGMLCGDGQISRDFRKEGSAPRILGSIGGGAIEYEVLQEASKCTQPFISEYLLNKEESAKLGMVCGGSCKVLFLPVGD